MRSGEHKHEEQEQREQEQGAEAKGAGVKGAGAVQCTRAIGAITMLVAVRSAVEQALQRPNLRLSREQSINTLETLSPSASFVHLYS